RVQTATSAAAAARIAGRSLAGTTGVSNPDSPNSDATGTVGGGLAAGARGGAAGGWVTTGEMGDGDGAGWGRAGSAVRSAAGMHDRPARPRDSSRWRTSRIN